MHPFVDRNTGGIIHVANIKGGVGKTTVATNLAAYLSRCGPTLLIDLDVQGSVSAAIGKEIGKTGCSSWELFKRRFRPAAGTVSFCSDSILRGRVTECESVLFGNIVGRGSLSRIITRVQKNLDFIPAGADLFKSPSFFQLNNLLFNLRIAAQSYTFIVIDTPSVWNGVAKCLYRNSDLNLIPVTLNALSTKSLRDYLSQVRSLVQSHPSVRIRIIKNEVAGVQESVVNGKLRTVNENRRFLHNLCEQAVYENKFGVSSLPRSIMFDLEIPESTALMNAQDEGRLLSVYNQYCPAAKAFEELGRRVLAILDRPIYKAPGWIAQAAKAPWIPRLAALLVLVVLFNFNPPVRDAMASRPLAPQQLTISAGGTFSHTFRTGESIFPVARYAISWFRARVPSQREVADYCDELVSIHNMTLREGEKPLSGPGDIPPGTDLVFFPPSTISNPMEKELVPVYRYFMTLVKDDFTCVTGDWCERGYGRLQPHFGMDIAAALGTKIVCPVNGVAVVKDETEGGRMLGVAADNAVIFFCHMGARYFKTGDSVHAGQVVGTVGITGRTTGPHVHIGYAVRSEGRTNAAFGKYRYLVTDPKLFYYREIYLNNLAEAGK